MAAALAKAAGDQETQCSSHLGSDALPSGLSLSRMRKEERIGNDVVVIATHAQHELDQALKLGHHALRYRELTVRGRYKTTVRDGGEYDEFDRTGAVYVTYLSGRTGLPLGCLRLLPTSTPHLISSVWPDSVAHVFTYQCEDVWEGSRLCIDRTTAMTDLVRWQVIDGLLWGMEEACGVARVAGVVGTMAPAVWDSVFTARGYSVSSLGPDIMFDDNVLSTRHVDLSEASRLKAS